MADSTSALAEFQKNCNDLCDCLEQWHACAIRLHQSYASIQTYRNSPEFFKNLTEQKRRDLIQRAENQQQQLNQVITKILSDLQTLSNILKQYAWATQEQLNAAKATDFDQWRWKQKKTAFGAGENPDFKPIASKFQDLMVHTFFIWKTTEKFVRIVQQVQGGNCAEWDEVSEIEHLDQIRCKLMGDLLQLSFVVSDQPPMVVKNRLELSVLLLSARRELGLEVAPVQTFCQVISEETAASLAQGKVEISSNDLKKAGVVDQKPKDLEYFEGDGVYKTIFKRTKVTVYSRKAQRKQGTEAIRKKYYLLFRTEIKLHHTKLGQDYGIVGSWKVFHLWTLSLPFVVSVHGTQDMKLWATILWDIAFSNDCGTVVPLRGEPSVPWSHVSEAIKGVFRLISTCKRGLSEEDLRYLKGINL